MCGMISAPTFASIRDDFSLLDSWEDRFRYVMELGRALPQLDEKLRVEANKVRGCASQVWLSSHIVGHTEAGVPIIHFDGDSDAHLVRGLVALLLVLVQDRDAADIATIDAHAAFAELGLSEHLSPQRSNGVASMITRVRADATAAMAAHP